MESLDDVNGRNIVDDV